MPTPLTHKPTGIKPNVPPFRVVVYGEPGVGKTTFALSFPKPLVIDTDGGLEGDAVADLSDLAEEWTPAGWVDLQSLVNWLRKEIKTKGYQTIVIDSIDSLADQILGEASAQKNTGRAENALEDGLIQSEQQDFGKVDTALRALFEALKGLSRSLGVHVVIVGAVREVDIEKKRFKRTIDVQPAVERRLLRWPNVLGELTVEQTKTGGEVRVLWTDAALPDRKCKSRFAALRPKVISPTFAKLAARLNPEESK